MEPTPWQSNAAFADMFERAPVGMMFTDLDMVWRRVNPALCAMLNRPREELEGSTFLDVTHPDDVAAGRGAIQRLQAGHVNSLQQEKRYLRRDGSAIWVSISVTPVVDDAGDDCGFLVICHNVDDRRRGERELERIIDYLEARLGEETDRTDKLRTELEETQRSFRAATDRIGALVEAMPDMVVRVERDGTILDFAGPIEIAPEISPDQFIGRTVQTVLPTEDSLRTMDMIAKVLVTGEPQRLSYELTISDMVRIYEARFVRCAEDEVLAVMRPIAGLFTSDDW